MRRWLAYWLRRIANYLDPPKLPLRPIAFVLREKAKKLRKDETKQAGESNTPPSLIHGWPKPRAYNDLSSKLAWLLSSYKSDSYSLEKSLMSCGTAVSNPTTSMLPASFGSAILNSLATIPTTISLAPIPVSLR